MYNCGPTVYDRVHIGNWRAFLFADLLRRWLEHEGYEVRQVMNITDVGHLTDDVADEGEDKIEAQARREGVDPWKISETYTDQFLADAETLIDGELVESATRREAAVGSLPAEVLARYERNLPSFGSSTVVRFSGADCSGCPYSMPAVEADRVKGLATGTLADCSECGRLVVR